VSDQTPLPPPASIPAQPVSQPVSQNITWHAGELDAAAREALLGPGAVLWFTGLSGSGKSTVARRVERKLLEQGYHVTVLDGDNVRHGLCGDLGFSPADRAENIRRVGEVCALFSAANVLTLAAFVSPYRADRQRVREVVGNGRFFEVFVDTPLAVCEARDPKGLYAQARAGAITGFTGIDAPYEAPEAPEVHLNTVGKSIDACAAEVIATLEDQGLLKR
jgi:adenylylsulfate kinase